MVATPQYIEEVIACCYAAAEANRHTAGREGNIVVPAAPPGAELLITADLHGNRRNFTLIQRLAALDSHPLRHLVLQEVCYGGPTYPANGGCMSHLLLEDVARLKVKYPDRVHFLLSNHEWAETTDYPILKSKRMLNLLFRMGIQATYGGAAEKVRSAYIDFLRSCPLAVRWPGGVFVCHTLPEGVDHGSFDQTLFHRPLDAVDWQEHGDLFRFLWGRDYRPENAQAFAKLVKANVLIHGHEPCADGFSAPNSSQIILDCCTEKACCLLLPVRERWTHAEVLQQVRPLNANAR